uniref:Uncharacterized protein n=1 Tax=Strongyloides venezuelensis TaxID=75913 RepID=A0A0K0G5N2_STRVS
MYNQLLNEFVKLKTNGVDNSQLIDQNMPMNISKKLNINYSIICRKKRKCATIEPKKCQYSFIYKKQM